MNIRQCTLCVYVGLVYMYKAQAMTFYEQTVRFSHSSRENVAQSPPDDLLLNVSVKQNGRRQVGFENGAKVRQLVSVKCRGTFYIVFYCLIFTYIQKCVKNLNIHVKCPKHVEKLLFANSFSESYISKIFIHLKINNKNI